jgi:alpha-D-ribose 1-methylphosphonate 5-triphosphate synthase subunit PhnH
MADLGTAVLEGGLADPARDSQRVFRAVLAAFSEPGTIHTVPPVAHPPEPFPPAMAAVALTLCDGETPVFLDPSFGEAAARWLVFHAGAPTTAERGAARFAFLAEPDLAQFATGDDAYPDRSATVVATACFGGERLTLSGPGIAGAGRIVELSASPALLAALAANRALFPRGIDLLLLDGERLMGLPRSTAVAAADGGSACS